MPFFTSFAGEIGRSLGEHRKQEADRAERQATLENAILQHLSTSTDPEIASRAVAGLLNQANPRSRRAKGLRGFLGETEGNPALPSLRAFIEAGQQAPEPNPPTPAPTPGSAAQPTQNARAAGPMVGSTPPASPGAGGAVGPAATPPPGPRRIFRTPDEQAALTHSATTRADVETKLDILRGGQRRGEPMTPDERYAIFGHQPPFRAPVAAGTGQGKMFPAGSVDNAGQPLNPEGYYAQRVNPLDPSDVSYFPVATPASAQVNSRWTPIHRVGPDGRTPGVWMETRDGSQPARFLGYAGARGSYLPFVDPDSGETTYIPAPAVFTPAPGAAPAVQTVTPITATGAAAAPPPGPPSAGQRPGGGPPAAPGPGPAAPVGAGGARPGVVGIPGGRVPQREPVEGAYLGPDGTPVAGTAFVDKKAGRYYSSQDPTQPAVGFIPGELGSYAVTAFNQANSTLVTIEAALAALEKAGLSQNTDPMAMAALMAKFYGGRLGGDPVAAAAASMTNLAGIQGATQYVRSNSRSYQMFQAALMHLPRAPSEAVAQRSQLPVVGGFVTPENTGMVGGHGWDSGASMRQKLEAAKDIIQQGKAALAELVGKSPGKEIGAASGTPGSPAAPTATPPPDRGAGVGRGRGAAPTGRGGGGAPGASAAPAPPTVGERRTINGQLAEWDGKGWLAVAK